MLGGLGACPVKIMILEVINFVLFQGFILHTGGGWDIRPKPKSPPPPPKIFIIIIITSLLLL